MSRVFCRKLAADGRSFPGADLLLIVLTGWIVPMMLFVIGFSAFFASLLTLYSGFGLGTLLMPVIAIFFPVPMAIAITAFVHLINNIFKFSLLVKNVSWDIVVKFGLPAILATIPGALLLNYLSRLSPLASYSFFGILATIEPVKIVAGILLIVFATFEWRSIGENAFFNSKWLPVGGMLSGFFGGLSGQQGAFRTPFLLHVGLSKEQFVATGAAIAVLVDGVRLLLYGLTIFSISYKSDSLLLSVTVLAAALGALLGVIVLKKITFVLIQRLVAMLLYVLGTFLLIGIL